MDWEVIWEFAWPVLRQALIALLVTVLGLLGYDKVVPSRSSRGRSKEGEG